MNCDEIRKLLDEYIDGRLRSEARESVENHLIDCARCKKEYSAILDTVNTLRSLKRVNAPDDFLRNVREKIELKKSGSECVVNTSFLRSPFLKIAASIVIVFSAYMLLKSRESQVFDVSSQYSKKALVPAEDKAAAKGMDTAEDNYEALTERIAVRKAGVLAEKKAPRSKKSMTEEMLLSAQSGAIQESKSVEPVNNDMDMSESIVEHRAQLDYGDRYGAVVAETETLPVDVIRKELEKIGAVIIEEDIFEKDGIKYRVIKGDIRKDKELLLMNLQNNMQTRFKDTKMEIFPQDNKITFTIQFQLSRS